MPEKKNFCKTSPHKCDYNLYIEIKRSKIGLTGAILGVKCDVGGVRLDS